MARSFVYRVLQGAYEDSDFGGLHQETIGSALAAWSKEFGGFNVSHDLLKDCSMYHPEEELPSSRTPKSRKWRPVKGMLPYELPSIVKVFRS